MKTPSSGTEGSLKPCLLRTQCKKSQYHSPICILGLNRRVITINIMIQLLDIDID